MAAKSTSIVENLKAHRPSLHPRTLVVDHLLHAA